MKRTALKRMTGLRRTGLKRKPPKRVVTDAVRAQVLDRAGDRCERCLCNGPLVLHHLRRRSQGGAHDATNLVALCGPFANDCHGWAHANPAQAIADGWLIRAGAKES